MQKILLPKLVRTTKQQIFEIPEIKIFVSFIWNTYKILFTNMLIYLKYFLILYNCWFCISDIGLLFCLWKKFIDLFWCYWMNIFKLVFCIFTDIFVSSSCFSFVCLSIIMFSNFLFYTFMWCFVVFVFLLLQLTYVHFSIIMLLKMVVIQLSAG